MSDKTEEPLFTTVPGSLQCSGCAGNCPQCAGEQEKPSERRIDAMKFLASTGPLPTSAMASAESPVAVGWKCSVCGMGVSPYYSYCPVCYMRQYSTWTSTWKSGVTATPPVYVPPRWNY